MSVRLQVILDEEDLEGYRRRAAQAGLTLSAWVRQALRGAAESAPSPAERLRALDAALRCGHPTGALDDMLRQIERGRDLR